MSKYKLVPAEPTLVAWVTEDTIYGQAANGKPRRIWWENNEGVGVPIYAAPQPAPEVTKLVEALEEMIDVAERVDGWESFPSAPIDRAEDAIRSYRKQGGEL